SSPSSGYARAWMWRAPTSAPAHAVRGLYPIAAQGVAVDDSPMRALLAVTGVVSAFVLSGCLPQFGCSFDDVPVLRNRVWYCVNLSAGQPPQLGEGYSPRAAFTFTASPISGGQRVVFTSYSTDDDFDIRRYEWDLDSDGLYETDRGQAIAAARDYPPGHYLVSLKVTDGAANSDTASQTFDVPPPETEQPAPDPPPEEDPPANAAPAASFTTSPNPGVAGESVHFDAHGSSDSDGEITDYAWDFEDDGILDITTSSPEVSFVYDTPGQKTARLRVHDNLGASGEATRFVLVRESEPGSGRVVAAAKGARFSARLRGRPLANHFGRKSKRGHVVSRRGLVAVGRFDGRRGLEGFMDGGWLARLDVSSNRRTKRARVRGLVLVTFDGTSDSQACLRFAMVVRKGRKPRGSFRVVGANGQAAGLSGNGALSLSYARDLSARLKGTLRIRRGATKAIPPGCARLARVRP
ncbi:MAG: hypothetical protein QOJ22_399, partial [Thermoleophilaceae bacterium]|nr:hypothetical protein [Thermoleophilaceae bacterium]